MYKNFFEKVGVKTFMVIIVVVTLAPFYSECLAKDYAPFLNEYLSGEDGQPPYRNRKLKNYLPNPALINDDYFSYYGISENNLTPLKKQMLLQSEEYQVKSKQMSEKKEEALNSYCHYTVGFSKPVYDLQNGGFELILEKGFNNNYSDPFLIFIPESLSETVKRNENDNIEFFVPISNLEEAVKIEDNFDYDVAIQFNYMPCEEIIELEEEDIDDEKLLNAVIQHPRLSIGQPELGNMVFALRDVILYKISSGEIVWTALLGDYSEGLRSKEELKYGNSKPISETTKRNVTVSDVELPASFPGGESGLMEYLARNIRYPEMAQQNGVEGRVIVKFIINKDGSVSEPEIVKSVSEELDREALRLVNKMPKWQPALYKGEPVKSIFTVPINFKLSKK